MIYFFLGLAAITFDNLIFAWGLGWHEMFTFIVVWFFSGAVASGVYALYKGYEAADIGFVKRHPYQVSLYLILSVLGIIFWALGVLEVGIGGSVILSRMGVLLSLCFGIFILKERFTKQELFFVLLMFLGIWFFSNDADPVSFQKGFLFIAGATLCYTTQWIINKTLSKKVPYHIMVFSRAVFVTIAVFILMKFLAIPMQFSNEYWHYIIVAIGGISGVFLNKYFYFRSLEYIPLAHFSLLTGIRGVLVYIISLFFFGEIFTLPKAFGAFLVLLSGAAITYLEHRERRSSDLKK